MRKSIKRAVSMVLLVSMLFSCMNLTWISMAKNSYASERQADGTITASQIVAQNYEFLNANERAIMSCSAVLGDSYIVNPPDSSDGLVSVDSVSKTVTAQEYKDGGYTWTPVSAKVLYKNTDGSDADPIPVNLTNGTGTFSCPSDRYTVEVEYSYFIDVDADVQEKIINAPAVLTEGIINLNVLSLHSTDLSVLGENIDGLYSLTTGELPLGLKVNESAPAYAAIMSFYNQTKDPANNGNLRLYNLIDAYEKSTNKVKYLIDNAELVKQELKVFCNDLYAICADDSAVVSILNVASNLDNPPASIHSAQRGLDMLRRINADYDDVNKSDWRILSNVPVKSDASESELAKLDSAVLAAIRRNTNTDVNYYEAPQIVNPLKVASVSITQGVDQYKVNVTVKGSVIGKDTINSNELTLLDNEAKTVLVLDKGTEKDDIVAAIETSKVKDTALASWDSYYNIGSENYDIIISELPDSLESDIVCTITYLPKQLKVTYNYAETAEEKVYYGYNLLLPKHDDTAKSYDYTVNGNLMREDIVIRIEADTEISRSEGKATDKYRVSAVIAGADISGLTLTDAEKNILASRGLVEENIWYRTPDQDLDLVSVSASDDSNVYNVTARNYASGLLSGAEWKAISGSVIASDGSVISDFSIDNGNGTFTCTNEFDHVKVKYAVSVSDISADEINKWINIPNKLVSEAAAQKTAIEPLYGDIYNNLPSLTQSRLKMVAALDCSAESKNTIKYLLDNSYADDGVLKLYHYLNDYKNFGLSYYYEENVYENMDKELNLLRDSLNILWNDDVLQNELKTNPDVSSFYPRLETVYNMLQDIELVEVNSFINRSKNSDLVGLVSLIEQAQGAVNVYNTSDSVLTLYADITGDAPDRVGINVTVQIKDSRGNIVNSATALKSFPAGEILTEEDVKSLSDMIDSLKTSMAFDESHYNLIVDVPVPDAGTAVNTSSKIIYTWTPKVYTVTIGGATQSFAADAGVFAITLPKWDGEAGYKYRYTIGTETVDVGSNAVTYRFRDLSAVDALFDENGNLTIDRTVVSIYREEVIKFVNTLNNSIAKNNATFNKDGQKALIASFIPLEDAETGNISIVLRVSPTATSADFKNLMTDAAMNIVDSYFDYIAIANKPLWDQKIHLQTVIDTVLESELGFDYICSIISDNGDLREITEDIPELAALNPVGMNEFGFIPVSGAAITDAKILGAKLIASIMQFGDASDDTIDVPFYVTMEDFDLSANTLKRLENGIVKAKKYLNVYCENGKANISLRAPESLYPYYMSAQTIAGNADIKNINAMDLGESINYDIDLFRDLLADSNFTLGTVERTLDKLGISRDLGEYDSLFSKARRAANYILDNLVLEGASDGAVYTGTASIGIRDALTNKLGVSDTLVDFVAEAADDSGIHADFEFTFENMNSDYDAMIVDVHASKLEKLTYTKDLASALTKANENSIIVLLSDVELNSDAVINNKAFIDLNGKTLKGNLSANGGMVRIFDSSLATRSGAGIDGTLTGAFTVTAGKYTTDISAMLREGYVQDELGYVVNKLYTVKEGENGDINVMLSPDFLKTENVPSLKTYASDLAVDLIVNMYQNAYFSVDGNVLYSCAVDDLISLLDVSPRSELVQMAIDFIDTDGLSAFVNQLLADFTNFAQMRENLDSGNAIASYSVLTKAWDLALSTVGNNNDNYIKASVLPSDNENNTKINILLDDTATADEKQVLSELLGNLADVVSIDELSFDLDKITYQNKSVSVDMKGVANVTVDLTKDKDYAFIIAAILAYSATGEQKTELVAAMKAYLDSGVTLPLKTAIENCTTSLLISAVKNIKSHSFADILDSLGIESSSAVVLESVYHDLLNIASVILSKTSVTGGSVKLGSAAKDEYGVYGFSRENWKKCDIDFTLKLFTEDKAVIVRNSLGKTVLETDDIAEAIEKAASGDIILVNAAAVLNRDVTVSSDITISGAANITFDAKILIGDPAVKIISDSALTVASGLTGYEVKETTEDGKYIYKLEKQEEPPIPVSAIIVKSADGTVKEYAKDNLAEALENAKSGDVIIINEPVTLLRNAKVNASVTIQNASKITLGSSTITLANAASSVTSDAKIASSTFVSGVNFYKVTESQIGSNFKYSLTALDPMISVPTVNTQADGLIRGSRVDSAKRYIYLDVSYEGLAAENFSLVNFATTNASTKTVVINHGSSAISGKSIISNGDTVTVTASNTAGKSVSVKYTIIILGDTNCNGRIEAGDGVALGLHYVNRKYLTGVALLAADTNGNGVIEAGDAVKNAIKYTFAWKEKSYVSVLGK